MIYDSLERLAGCDYEIVYADPPWQYQDRNCNGSAEQHYNTMPLSEIKRLPIGQITAIEQSIQ